MTAWDNYEGRHYDSQFSRRTEMLKRESRLLTRKMKDSLSYFSVTVDTNAMGVATDISTKNVVIIDSDNLDEKYIYSLPGESLVCGSLVTWSGSYWLITQLDSNTELRTKGIMVQCNHQLKWKDSDGNVISQWVVVDDGTKLSSLVSAQRKLCA